MPKRLCPYCLMEEDWILSDLRLKDGTKVYINEEGDRWAGRRCPGCEKKRVKQAITFDDFDRSNICEQLQKSGYEVLNKTLPLKVRQGCQIFAVEIRRGYIKDGRIIMDRPRENPDAILVILFREVRILGVDQIDRLHAHLEIHHPPRDSGTLK